MFKNFWISFQEDVHYVLVNLPHEADFAVMDACQVNSEHTVRYGNLPWCTRLHCQMLKVFYDAISRTEWTATAWAVFRVLKGHITWAVNAAICRLLGHRMVDCSHAGPESGDMDMFCDRCGRYWDIPLY